MRPILELNHHGAYVDLPESWIYLKIAVWKMMINYQFLAHPISDNQPTFLGLTVSGSASHPVPGFPETRPMAPVVDGPPQRAAREPPADRRSAAASGAV